MLANLNLHQDLKLAARHGRVVIVGSRGQIAIDPRDIMTRELTVTGVMMLNATLAEMVCAQCPLPSTPARKRPRH